MSSYVAAGQCDIMDSELQHAARMLLLLLVQVVQQAALFQNIYQWYQLLFSHVDGRTPAAFSDVTQRCVVLALSLSIFLSLYSCC